MNPTPKTTQLIIWTSADSNRLSDVIGGGLKALRPNIPTHRFIAFAPSDPVPVPAEGEVVLVLGNKCLEALQKAGYATKGRKVASMREKIIKPENCEGTYFVSYDPGIINSEPDKRDIIHWDLQLVARFIRTGSLKPEVGEYEWMPDLQNTIDWIEEQYELTGKPVDVSVDTETLGLNPYDPEAYIVTLQVTVMEGQAQLLYFGPNFDPCPLNPEADIHAQVTWLLNSPKVKLRGANLKYDLIWIAEKWGIECTNFRFDTLLVGSMLNENRSNSLNLHAKTLTTMGGYDDELNAKYDKSRMDLIPPEDLLVYAGGDSDATQRTANVMRQELAEDRDLARLYMTVVHPAARAFEKVERRGLLVDVERYSKLRDDVTAEIDNARQEALKLLPGKLKVKYRDKIEEQLAQEKSPFTPKVLKDFFFSPEGLNLKPKLRTEKTDEPVLARHHLRMFNDRPEAAAFVKLLETESSASKTRSTFIDGFLKHLRPGNLFHPSYMLFKGGYNDDEDDESGTVTGRLSAKDPAIQTLPKKTKWAKRLRECFIAPEGKYIVMFDYSQGELRVVACVAGEQTMLDAYEKGLDLHAITGAKLGGYDLDEFLGMKDSSDEEKAALFDELRGKAKPANFGLLYGMGAEGFQAYCWAQYNLALTLTEAEQMREAFFELYPGLLAYHEDMRNFVRQWEHVRSPIGRVRHLPTIKSWDQKVRSEAQRQAINSPIQSTLSDMMIWAIARIDAEFGEDVAIVGMIHDAFVAYVDIAKWPVLAPQVQDIMQSLPLHELGWEPQLKFPADGEFGFDLAHTQKFKVAA